MQNRPIVKLIAAGILAAGVMMNGCTEKTAASAPANSSPAEVAVTVIEPQPVTLTTELSGRISAHRIAEVRPQVGGIIQKRLFTEGSDVVSGQVLYQIDAATYKAAYASARAALARAEAKRLPARLKADRFKDLMNFKAVSHQDYDDAAAALKQAEADVQAAEAEVERARINLDYTSVKAPISGRIGRSSVTTGALVTAVQTSPLATIQQLDPVYVDVTRSSIEMLRLKRKLASGAIKTDAANRGHVRLLLEDGSTYPLPGTLKFSDVTVNPSTGSVMLRTAFPNPDKLLLPGMFVRVILEEGINEQAILVPQQGVTRNPQGDATALVVKADDTVELRVLKIDRAIGDQWLVNAGLDPGDRLIVEGLQKARPGKPVKVVMFGAKSEASPPGSAASQSQVADN
ncbi:MAG: efflux RND transporter periplasmic adaptor subunit [Desulfobacteraceae bacterium]